MTRSGLLGQALAPDTTTATTATATTTHQQQQRQHPFPVASTPTVNFAAPPTPPAPPTCTPVCVQSTPSIVHAMGKTRLATPASINQETISRAESDRGIEEMGEGEGDGLGDDAVLPIYNVKEEEDQTLEHHA